MIDYMYIYKPKNINLLAKLKIIQSNNISDHNILETKIKVDK